MTDETTPNQGVLHRNLAAKGNARHDDRLRRLDSASKPPTKATPGVAKRCLPGVYVHRFTSPKRLKAQGFFESLCFKTVNCNNFINVNKKFYKFTRLFIYFVISLLYKSKEKLRR